MLVTIDNEYEQYFDTNWRWRQKSSAIKISIKYRGWLSKWKKSQEVKWAYIDSGIKTSNLKELSESV